MIIHVRNPYFDEIRFQLNDRSVELESEAPQRMANAGVGRLLSGSALRIDPEYNVAYRHYKQMGEEIQDALLHARQAVRDASAASAAEASQLAAPWSCPACGGQNESGKFCEFCGTPRPQ